MKPKRLNIKITNLLYASFLATLMYAPLCTALPEPQLIATTPPERGIFALAGSQQPAAYFAFGETLVDKGLAQLFIFPTYLKAPEQHYFSFTASLLYGITDTTSVMLSVPYDVSLKSGNNRSSGWSDLAVQLEQSIYSTSNATSYQQATIVGIVTAPTGSFRSDPSTGLGAPSFFIGSTYNKSYVEWFWFVSPGATWIEANQNIQLGMQYLYQGGLGRNIKSEPNHYIFAGMVELLGVYEKKDSVQGHYDPNSGGNLIFMAPSLLYSTPKWQLQWGVSIPIVQQWNGNQTPIDYFTTLTLGINLN